MPPPVQCDHDLAAILEVGAYPMTPNIEFMLQVRPPADSESHGPIRARAGPGGAVTVADCQLDVLGIDSEGESIVIK